MFRSHGSKKGGGPFGFLFTLFRLGLSLVIMGVLLLGIYQAYKTFSGVDLLKVSTQSLTSSFLSSDEAYKLITSILSAKPEDSLTQAKKFIKEGKVDLPQPSTIKAPDVPLDFKFAIVTDSHNDNEDLKKALTQAKDAGAKFAVGLGDYTNVGTPDELRSAKLAFDTVNLSYYVTPGDHDLWDSRNRNLPAVKGFTDVFGSPYQSFAYSDARFILVYDSDNYLGLNSAQLTWLEGELSRVNQDKPKNIFIMTSSPLFHPSSDHFMGKVTPKLIDQAEHLRKLFKDSNVSEVFAGDVHFYSRYTDPKYDLKMTVVGAVTKDRNAQNPRYVMVDVYIDGSYNIEDLEIK